MMPIREERSGTRRGRELRQTVTAALALAVALFFLPLLAVRGEPLYTPEGADALPEDAVTVTLSRCPGHDGWRVITVEGAGLQ